MCFSLVLPPLVTLVGGYFLIRLRFFFILHPIRTAKSLVSALSEREARRQLFLALAGTLGVGNIFGVAMGIIIGGEGVLFWLFVSSLFSSVIKYAEALAAGDFCKGGFGTASLIKRTYPFFGGGASKLYSFLSLSLALVMGGAIQSDSVAETAEGTLGLAPWLSAAVLSALVLLVVVGGAQKILSATEKIIPLTTLVYIILALLAIFARSSCLPHALERIFHSAFSPAATTCGTFSAIFSRALSEGYARGILSNEAGAGTSAMAHSRSGASPFRTGLFGLCEVFFDTPLLCTLTGLVIVLGVREPSRYTSAMALVTDAFSVSLGAFSGFLVFVCVLFFAYSTVICWFYYGCESLLFLFGREIRPIYTLFFISFIFLGALSDSFFMLSLCDTILFLMTVLTLTALLLSSRRIVRVSLESGIVKPKEKRRK